MCGQGIETIESILTSWGLQSEMGLPAQKHRNMLWERCEYTPVITVYALVGAVMLLITAAWKIGCDCVSGSLLRLKVQCNFSSASSLS